MSPPLGVPAPDLDKTAQEATSQRLNALTKPIGSLGRLEELAMWAAAVQGQSPPQEFSEARLVIFAGDHGVSKAGTSAFPPEVTAQMVANFVANGAAANVLAARAGVAIIVTDLSVDSEYEGLEVPPDVWQSRIRRSSGQIDQEDALTKDQASAAWQVGADLADDHIDSGADLLIVGDMGIGNTTPAAALVSRLTATEPHLVCGRGTGIDDEIWMRKLTVIRDALWRTIDLPKDPITTVAALGGADIAAMAGYLAQAATRRTPVILDGVVSTTAALLAAQAVSGAEKWWLAGHRSVEPAHTKSLESLKLNPVLDLQMRLGEGSGALLALPILQSAIALTNEMATFESAEVSGRI